MEHDHPAEESQWRFLVETDLNSWVTYNAVDFLIDKAIISFPSCLLDGVSYIVAMQIKFLIVWS